jgi:hypothetical protein
VGMSDCATQTDPSPLYSSCGTQTDPLPPASEMAALFEQSWKTCKQALEKVYPPELEDLAIPFCCLINTCACCYSI